jgi:hypothetical protein
VIVERFPELEQLTPDAQLELAAELAILATRNGAVPPLSSGSIDSLEEQLDYFLEHPESGVPWEDLRQQR